MASINSRPLKAYVRFDGTGRIVPSSLILRRKMPKVGKWKEIPAYECCNPTQSTPLSVPLPPSGTTTLYSKHPERTVVVVVVVGLAVVVVVVVEDVDVVVVGT